MSNQQTLPKPIPKDEPKEERPKWTGIARSMECSYQNGFNNFRIITLKIVGGIVVDRHVSEPYASFEAIARLEVEINKAALSLNFNYHHGKTWDQ